MSQNNQADKRGTLRSVGEILGSAMPQRLALHIKIGEIKDRWREVAGEALAARSSPVMFEYAPDGGDVYLLISASSPVAAQRAQMSDGIISRRLMELWRIEITGVRVKVV